jgi:hypothetical protein
LSIDVIGKSLPHLFNGPNNADGNGILNYLYNTEVTVGCPLTIHGIRLAAENLASFPIEKLSANIL